MKNWKTTLAGFLLAIIALAVAMGKITQPVGEAIGAILISLGLVASKDHNAPSQE